MAMTLFKRSATERMLQPQALSLSGTQTALGRLVTANIQNGGFTWALGTEGAPCRDADLAIIMDEPADVGAALAMHASRGAGGAMVLSAAPRLRMLARRAGIRVIGPHAFGILLPGAGLNASAFPLAPLAGGVALVAQSASLARSVIDWAVPNNIGFSRIIGIGGNADIGFGLVLDQLSRDPATKAILIEIDRLRDPKLFFSAGRGAGSGRQTARRVGRIPRRHRSRLRPRRRVADRNLWRVSGCRGDPDTGAAGASNWACHSFKFGFSGPACRGLCAGCRHCTEPS
jgi:acetyltransferase